MASNLDADQLKALLHLLATDDAYRELFQARLPEALAQLPGSPKPPADLPEQACLRPARLASKEKLLESRDRIIETWLSRGPQIPHILEP